MELITSEVREYFNRENYEYFSMGSRLAQKSYMLPIKANSEFTRASYLSITLPFTVFVLLHFTD